MTEPAKDTPYVAAARRQWEMDKRASEEKKLRIVKGKIVTYTPDPPAHDLEKTLAMAREEENLFLINKATPGQRIEGHGVFAGTWQPQGLSQVFNVFAAPEDLTDEINQRAAYTYTGTVKRIASLKDWHSFDGEDYASNKDLYKALEDGSYSGGWFMPPVELLTGKDAAGRVIQPDNLIAHKYKGALSGTFVMAVQNNKSVLSHWYWSSTESPPHPSKMLNIRFWDGISDWNGKDQFRMSCRPVRLEPRS